ncbi:PhoX family protein [Streptomyces sp. NBC_01231]|nr:PhoX family protein [Streptomyces sp. NBC_01231]
MRRRGGDAQRGRPWRLPLEDRLLLLAKYWRTNLTLQQVAPIFRGSKPAVNRVLHHLALLAISPTRGPRKDAVYIVDGTLAPTHDRSVAKSSKNYRYSTNLQVVIDANSRQGNKHGHILELEEQRGDAAAKNFHWKLLPVCGAPKNPSTYFAGFDKSQVSPISCPDSAAFDEHDNLWIATNGAELGFHDGLFTVPLNGAERGHVKQFLSMPKGAECGGPIITQDRILVAPQHPGETTGATAENPGSA